MNDAVRSRLHFQANGIALRFDNFRCLLWVKSRHQRPMLTRSALPPKADINSAVQNVCFVPIADIRDV